MGDLTAPLDRTRSLQGQSGSAGSEQSAGGSPPPGTAYYRSIVLLIVGAVAIITVIAIGTTVTVINSRESALASSERELANTALLLAKDIDQKVDELESIRTGIAKYIQSQRVLLPDQLDRTMSGEDVRLELKHRTDAFPFIDNIAIVNSDGILLNASGNEKAKGISVVDRKFFTELKSDPQLTFNISEPLQGRIGGQWKIIIAWKLNAPDGKFLGLISAAIRLAYFEDYFRSLALGKGSLVTLQRADGTILVRYPRIERVIGRAYYGMAKVLENRDEGVVRLVGKMQDKQLILAAHRLSRYPLFVTAGMDSAFVLDAWWRQATAMIGLGAAAALMTAIMAFIVARRSSDGKRQFQKQFDDQAKQLNAAFSHMSQGLVMFNSAAQLVICNDRYRQLYGLPADLVKPGCALEDLISRRVADNTLPGSAEDFVRDLLTKIARGEMVQHEITLNNERIISVKNQPLPCGGWVATHEDITDKRRAELELDETKRFLDSIFENIPVAVVVKDAKTRKFILVNQAFETMLGLPRADLLGRTVFDIYKREHAERIDQSDSESLQGVIGVNSNEYEMEVPMRGQCVLTTSRIVMRDAHGDAKYLVVVISDITERKKSEQRIAFMAHHDALTGLSNRTAITQKIEEAAARQRRRGEPFAVLLLDLDRFKQVNDTLGHPAGDALLREVATRLKDSLRENDILARLGGDEFAVIQPGESNQREAASALANRIIEIVAKPFMIEGNELNIATSIGISLAPEHTTNPDDLLKMADLALYCAKSTGRSNYCIFDPEMGEAASARHELENELRRAILQDELELYYQPIVDTQTRKICGAEALVRWRHPTKGMVLPDRFIPLAEETGMIAQIGEWVLQAACMDAARWPDGISVSVNLSAIQFRKSNLPDVVMYALAQSGLAPERLELEITETALIEGAAECLPALRQFKNLGISVALDDFGTGYSSLSQLIMFPFNKIKIDKTFIQNMTKRVECAAIILAAQTLAQSLNMAVTAEGVETIEQYRLLRLTRVTSLQGYLFKGPCPVTELDFDMVYGDLELEHVA